MSKPHSLHETKRAAVGARLKRARAELGSYDKIARELWTKTGYEISGQGLLNASNGHASAELAASLEKLFGEKMDEWLTALSKPESSSAPRAVDLITDERYPNVAIAFSRALAAGVDEQTLRTVRLRIGSFKGPSDGPPVEDVATMIADEVSQVRRFQRRVEATDLDEGIPPPKAKRRA